MNKSQVLNNPYPDCCFMGGYIRSQHDGEIHYISPKKLQRLYHILGNHHFYLSGLPRDKLYNEVALRRAKEVGAKLLYPREDGCYDRL